MSTLQTSIASALRNAGIHFTGGTWLRLKGDGLAAISVNATSGGWIDHRTSDHGNFHALAEKIGIDSGGIYIPHPSSDWQKDAKDAAVAKDSQSKQFARTHWARGIPSTKPARQKGWSQAAWDAEQTQYQDCRDAIYDYLASRGLDPLPLLPMIKFSTEFNSAADNEMQNQGADFWFMLPMYGIGKPQIAGNICGIQRTYLKFGEDRYHPVAMIARRMLGKKGVTEIKGRSHPISLPTDLRVLGIGEGFETVASFVQATGRGGLITWDWSGLKAWSQSLSIKANALILALLVDNDSSQTGQRESAAALRRITAQEHGKAVYLLPPECIHPNAKGNRDWNDLLKQSGPVAVAAEIVRAWHKSDDNLALAPDPLNGTTTPLKKDQGPSNAEVKQAIADAVARPAASEAMKKAISDYEQEYARYLELLAKWSKMTPEERKANGAKKPKLPPMLIKVTTGVGKSHQIRDLLQNTKLPLLILTRTHELAAEYAAAGAFPYHGRSEPAIKTETYTADFLEKNRQEFGSSDCFKYPVVKITSENNHVPALTACRNCEHGRKFMIENYDPRSQPYQNAQDWFAKTQLNPNTVPSCLWLSHQMEAGHARIVVAPNASFSESLATWQTPDGPVPRLVIVDELPDLTREIKAHSGDMGNNVANAQKAIKYLQSHSDDDEEAKAKIINDLGEAIDLFKSVAEWMSSTLDKGIQQIPDTIVAQVKKLHVDWLPGATARWEKAEIRYGHEPFVPLRMMKAMIESIGTGTALAEKGILHIREVTALGEHVSNGKPCILLDATPSRAVEAIVKANEEQIVHAIAKQHINLVHYHQYLHGRTWKNKDHQKDELTRLLAMREQMKDENGNVPNVLTYMPLCDLAAQNDASDWGYFGRDDIGQDRWKAQDLLGFGGSMFGPDTQAIVYNADLMLMRLAGIKGLPDWSTEIDRDQEITVGDNLIQSKAPLPSDPYLRDWVLSDYGRRVAQAIGRVRGVWASPDKPINVWIVGGLPLAGLCQHGIAVNEYRQEKPINLRDEAHQRAVEKVQVAMAALQAADQDPSYRQINKWLAEKDLPGIRYEAWKSIVNKASTGPNKDTYEPVDDLLASLESLQKVANWNGQDISDVALNTWDAPGIDPEIRIAAEIVLEVSPYTDRWRQAQRDG